MIGLPKRRKYATLLVERELARLRFLESTEKFQPAEKSQVAARKLIRRNPRSAIIGAAVAGLLMGSGMSTEKLYRAGRLASRHGLKRVLPLLVEALTNPPKPE